MMMKKQCLENSTEQSLTADRSFSVGDWVVYKLFDNCDKKDISKKGKVIEVLDDGFYIVTFGYESIYGTRTSKYYWTKLWLV